MKPLSHQLLQLLLLLIMLKQPKNDSNHVLLELVCYFQKNQHSETVAITAATAAVSIYYVKTS